MFVTSLHSANDWFEVLQTTERSQTAIMNLDPGAASGDELDEHDESDQVLLVLEGEVMAEVGEESARLREGDVVIIPAGIRHRFKNNRPSTARTFSVYAPPAYPPGMRG
jgi:mannose-6-phosphate isomerase-like protein (cupin superfamily)